MSTVAAAPVIAVAAPRTRPAAQRFATLDAARWIAACAIVWIHVPHCRALESSTDLARFAVPFFVAASVFLVCDGLRRNPDRGFWQYAQGRVLRIYLPFLAWSGVYLVFKLVKLRLLPDASNVFPGVEVLWRGSFCHLWFMPFILVLTLAAFGLNKWLLRRPAAQRPAAVACAATGLILCLPPVIATLAGTDEYRGLMVNALPVYFWTLAMCLSEPRSDAPAAGSVEGLDAIVCLLCLAWLGCMGRSAWVENLAGLCLLRLTLQARPQAVTLHLARYAPLAYGVYLAHLLPIKILEPIVLKLHIPHVWWTDCAMFVLALIVSSVLVWALSCWRATRWAVA